MCSLGRAGDCSFRAFHAYFQFPLPPSTKTPTVLSSVSVEETGECPVHLENRHLDRASNSAVDLHVKRHPCPLTYPRRFNPAVDHHVRRHPDPLLEMVTVVLQRKQHRRRFTTTTITATTTTTCPLPGLHAKLRLFQVNNNSMYQHLKNRVQLQSLQERPRAFTTTTIRTTPTMREHRLVVLPGVYQRQPPIRTAVVLLHLDLLPNRHVPALEQIQ